MKFDCKVVGLLSDSYGKFGQDQVSNQIIMEYNEMFPFLSSYLPKNLTESEGFMEYLD